jgi:predicted ATPase
LDLLARHLTNVQIADSLSISVRTVESHVSSLLRKLQLSDRRSLARTVDELPAGSRPLPQIPTSFVGRDAERLVLAAAVRAHRMVTATGPGGVGKTRLALQVADDLSGRFADGTAFVDLVQLNETAMVAVAVAEACGAPERHGSSVHDALIASIGHRHFLVVVDNCEHLLDGVRDCLGALLAGCPNLTVLATSRARLLTAYEHVYAVPGLSEADAVALFNDRASAAGAATADVARVAALCRALDGMALAIELAAARCATLGLDGLEAGLDERLRFLSVGGRIPDRHRSLNAAIAWSYDLLDGADRHALRTLSVFASWFDAVATTALVGGHHATNADMLGRLADQSLLVVRQGTPTRYRMLEAIRQFGVAQLTAAGEEDDVRARHCAWASRALEALAPDDARTVDDEWCSAADAVLDDGRAALAHLAATGDGEVEADLASTLATVLYARGRPAETQRRLEQAAGATSDPSRRRRSWRLGSTVAASRHVGQAALSLLQRAADEEPDGSVAACDLAQMSIYITRNPGIMAEPPTRADALIPFEEARARSGGSPLAEAALATASSYLMADADPAVVDEARRAARLAGIARDPLFESAALDQLCAAALAANDLVGARKAVEGRERLLRDVPIDAGTGFEMEDFTLMASEVHLAAGDLATARRYADELAALPFIRDEPHLALARRIKVDAMAGGIDDVAAAGERFREGWISAGRPVASNLASTAAAVEMAHGLRGDELERIRWREISDTLNAGVARRLLLQQAWRPTFDGILALHRGDVRKALGVLAADGGDDDYWGVWHKALWRPWYVGAWVEAAVLARTDGARYRVDRGRHLVRDNPIAAAVVERAAAILDGRTAEVEASAHRFAALGCTYQRDRSLHLATTI